MRNVKKTVAWILGLVMLLSLGAVAAESALPEIPAFTGTLNVRPVATAEEAVEYAKEFWALDFVGMDMTGAAYEAQAWQDDGWLVTAVVGDASLDVAFDRDGNVVYMENILSGWTDIGGGMGGAEEGEAFVYTVTEGEKALTLSESFGTLIADSGFSVEEDRIVWEDSGSRMVFERSEEIPDIEE